MTTIRCPSCGHQHAAPADERDRRTIEAQQEELHRLRGENERLRREYEEEVDEFNAGCDARKAGLNIHAEPAWVIHDMWRVGWIVEDYDIRHRAPQETAPPPWGPICAAVRALYGQAISEGFIPGALRALYDLTLPYDPTPRKEEPHA